MKIVVCVKRSTHSDQALIINKSSGWITENESKDLPGLGMYDEMAVEQALMIKDKIQSATVEVITVGAPGDSSVVRRAMGMGADTGAHVITRDEAYVSAYVTALRLADVLDSKEYDLVLTGALSEDMRQGVVGPMLAEILGVQCVTSCSHLEVDVQTGIVKAERDIEGARKQIVEMDLPGLATIQACRNKPRYPSLSNILRAHSVELETIYPSVTTEESHTEKFIRFVNPKKNRLVRFLQGTTQDKARELVLILRRRGLLA